MVHLSLNLFLVWVEYTPTVAWELKLLMSTFLLCMPYSLSFLWHFLHLFAGYWWNSRMPGAENTACRQDWTYSVTFVSPLLQGYLALNIRHCFITQHEYSPSQAFFNSCWPHLPVETSDFYSHLIQTMPHVGTSV